MNILKHGQISKSRERDLNADSEIALPTVFPMLSPVKCDHAYRSDGVRGRGGCPVGARTQEAKPLPS